MPPPALAHPALEPAAPDWLLAPVLYAQGIPAATIAARIGVSHDCLRQRALRQGWSRLRDELAHSASLATEKAIDTILDGHSSDTRKALGKAMAQHVALMPQATGWKQAVRLQEDLEPLVRNARVVFGWGEGDKQGVVQITNLSAHVTLREREPASTTPVLEAECTSSSTPAIAESTLPDAPA